TSSTRLRGAGPSAPTRTTSSTTTGSTEAATSPPGSSPSCSPRRCAPPSDRCASRAARVFGGAAAVAPPTPAVSQIGALPCQASMRQVARQEALMGDSELQALRRHGFGVAYRMLGSISEAEDVAQEALLRLTRQEGPIDEPAAWVTTVATRLSINVLNSARARRESYVGPWLPEPLVEDPAPGPASRAELADSLSLALLVLLERLTPVERAAYLLREVFGYEYAEIAGII